MRNSDSASAVSPARPWLASSVSRSPPASTAKCSTTSAEIASRTRSNSWSSSDASPASCMISACPACDSTSSWRSRLCSTCSARLRSPMSRAISAEPTTRPCASAIGDRLSRTGRRRPSRASRSVSSGAMRSPWRSRSSRRASSSRSAAGTNSSIVRPTTSAAGAPNSCSAVSFNAVTRPSASRPTMASCEAATIAASRASPSWRRTRSPMSTSAARQCVAPL